MSHPLHMVFGMDRLKNLTVTFADDLNADLLDLKQHSTYWGLLAGGDSDLRNAEILAECTRTEGTTPIHLIRPTELWVEGDHSNLSAGPVRLLPGLQCEGLFDARGRWLRVAWFQEQWTPTIDPLVQEQFRRLDFMALSVERAGGW